MGEKVSFGYAPINGLYDSHLRVTLDYRHHHFLNLPPPLDIVKTADGIMFNQAAQIWNHTFYWNSLSPNGGGEPKGLVVDCIKKDFGSFSAFKEKFSAAAGGHFGSGWAWLLHDPKSDQLKIHQTHDAGNPLRYVVFVIYCTFSLSFQRWCGYSSHYV